MSVEERIEAAWESYCGDAELNPNIHPEKQDGFREGYLAALASLFVEVRPENMRPGETYLMLIDGEWIERQCVTVEYLRQLAGFADKIYRLSLPSPASVFGGEA